jgi:myo-inositol-1(or 4)-monophosphatase
MRPDPEEMRAVARRAALIGGEVVGSRARPTGAGAKGLPGDWVTEIDVASERAISGFLREETPGVPVQGEELGGAAAGLRWVVDPLDGTTNYLHGFWAVGVAVALVEGDTVLAGAVHAPFLGETWHAAHGRGAVWEHDGQTTPCGVSRRPPERAIVGTGFPFRHKERISRYLGVFEGALRVFEDLRRPGAASLDLAWVACGVFEGFFELGLAPWDVAAGGILIEEAGGIVTDWEGSPDYLTGNILAGSSPIHAELLRIARDHEPA